MREMIEAAVAANFTRVKICVFEIDSLLITWRAE